MDNETGCVVDVCSYKHGLVILFSNGYIVAQLLVRKQLVKILVLEVMVS